MEEEKRKKLGARADNNLFGKQSVSTPVRLAQVRGGLGTVQKPF